MIHTSYHSVHSDLLQSWTLLHKKDIIVFFFFFLLTLNRYEKNCAQRDWYDEKYAYYATRIFWVIKRAYLLNMYTKKKKKKISMHKYKVTPTNL